MDEKKLADWLLIEADYRTGIKPLRQIASEHGIVESYIRKRAAKEGWERDLSARIQAKAEELVRKEAVRKETVRTEVRKHNRVLENENEIIEANANLQKDVVLSHRKDIKRLRNLLNVQAAELENIDGSDLDLSKRIKALKDLGDTLKGLICIEREAYGIDVRFEEKEEKLVVFDATETARRVAFLLAQADTKTDVRIEATTEQFTGIYHASRHEVSASPIRTM